MFPLNRTSWNSNTQCYLLGATIAAGIAAFSLFSVSLTLNSSTFSPRLHLGSLNSVSSTDFRGCSPTRGCSEMYPVGWQEFEAQTTILQVRLDSSRVSTSFSGGGEICIFMLSVRVSTITVVAGFCEVGVA